MLDGPINGVAFQRYVAELLAPALSPGDVVILDNLGSHEGKAVRDAIRAVAARFVFLLPDSPDLNPIEQLFAKLKDFMRKAGERSVETTWRRAGALLDRFKPEEWPDTSPIEGMNSMMFAYTIFTAGLAPIVIAGFYKDKLKVTATGALAAIIGGGATGLISKINNIKYLDLGALGISVVLLFAVSWIDRYTRKQRIPKENRLNSK